MMERQVTPSPMDGVTKVRFRPGLHSSLFVSSSWSGHLTLYDAVSAARLASHQEQSPVLDLDFRQDANNNNNSDNNHVWFSTLNGNVALLDWNRNVAERLGKHHKGVKCVLGLDTNVVASAGWDQLLCIWDSRVPHAHNANTDIEIHNHNVHSSASGVNIGTNKSPKDNAPTSYNDNNDKNENKGINAPTPFKSIDHRSLSGKAFAITRAGSTFTKLVIGTSNRRLQVFDTRMNHALPELDMESPLPHQIRSIDASHDGSTIFLGSTEGRVSVEPIFASFSTSPSPSDASEQDPNHPLPLAPFSFKCHRVKNTVYPVNCIRVVPEQETFATGGADGTVCVWDARARKRVASLGTHETSIASIDFGRVNNDKVMVIAVSYTFEEGMKDSPPDVIKIRTLDEKELRPKAQLDL